MRNIVQSVLLRHPNHTFGGFIKGILRGVRCTKSLRVLFLHRRPPSWTTLVLYSRAVFIFNEPAFYHMLSPPSQSRQSAKRFSNRWNWDSLNPLAAGECAPPTLWSGEGEGTLACGLRGGGVPIPTRGHTLRCSIYISTLCPPLSTASPPPPKKRKLPDGQDNLAAPILFQ